MQPKVSSQVLSKLHALRRSISAWLLVRGVAIVLAALVVLLLLSLWLDWSWMLDRPQRIICIVVALAVLAYLMFRHLLKPLTRKLDEETLALHVEGKHRELREGLINALQFSKIKDPSALGLSPQMVEATIASGNEAAQKADFRDVLDRSVFVRNACIVAFFLLALGALAVGVAKNKTLGIWFNRMFMLGDDRYPRNTQFVFKTNDKGELLLPRGDDWEAAVQVTGVVPQSVYIDYAPNTGDSVTQLMARQGEENANAKEGQFTANFKNIIEEFRFRVRGGDNRMDWIPVRLVDRPSIDSFDLTLEHPRYTAREPQVVWSIRPAVIAASGNEKSPRQDAKAGSSSISPLKGSTIRFTATSNKPLQSATLKWENGELPLTIEEAQGKDDAGNARKVSSFSAVLSEEQLTSATYAIDLLDTEGLESKRPTRFIVRLRADKDPTVRAQLLGISSMIVTDARIPIESTFRDDYAVTAAALNFQFRGESEEAPKGSDRIPFTDVKLNEQDVTERGYTHVYRWEVGDLKMPVGTNMTFHVDVQDNDTISGPKIGKSTAFFVRVVTPEDLRAELTRREQEQRQEFERLIKTQDDLIAETRIVLATGGTQPQLSAALRQSLMQSQKRQKLTADRCKAIGKQYDNILLEVINNRLEDEDGPVRTRLEGKVIQPLYNLGEREGIAATDKLDAVRKASDGAAREKALQAALAQQIQMADQMREVLKNMVRWSNYQEAVNLLYQVLTTQGQVNRETFRAHQARLQGIFGEGDKPK